MKKTKKKKEINSSIAYKGQVNIELRDGNKTIAKSSYHNEGTLVLFQFLSRCLRGDYNEVEIIRPKFIKLFTIGEKGDSNPYPTTYDTFNKLVNASSTQLLSLTSPIYSGGVNIIDSGSEEAPSSSVTFKFVIPFSQMKSYANINMIALYSALYKDYKTDASMFIIIKDSNNKLLDLLEEMGIENIDGNNNYNLFIEWTTTVKNEGE